MARPLRAAQPSADLRFGQATGRVRARRQRLVLSREAVAERVEFRGATKWWETSAAGSPRSSLPSHPPALMAEPTHGDVPRPIGAPASGVVVRQPRVIPEAGAAPKSQSSPGAPGVEQRYGTAGSNGTGTSVSRRSVAARAVTCRAFRRLLRRRLGRVCRCALRVPALRRSGARRRVCTR
jgi:hypothetical protein